MKKVNPFQLCCVMFLLCVLAVSTASAQTFTTLALFNGTNGALPGDISLVQGFDGKFYGTTWYGGPSNAGVGFSVSPTGTLVPVYDLGGVAGNFPNGQLVLAPDGDFYGATQSGGAFGEGAAFELASDGTVSNLYNFCSQANCDDGSLPLDGLIQATDGNFYGTAAEGGAHGPSTGTVFKISPTGTFTLFYSFCQQTNCDDGVYPLALMQASDESFYGTTFLGGSGGVGTVFKITRAGVFTLLHTFCSLSTCLGQPSAGLVQGNDGNFYGTTSDFVFKMTPSGVTSPLARFCDGTDCPNGNSLEGGVIQASDGNFYGTAELHGPAGGGTVFKLTPSGTVTVLHSFCSQPSCADGANPMGLVQGTNGILYGTTFSGGESGVDCIECGTVYSISLGLSPFVKTIPIIGTVGETINILGQGFTGASAVTFNGVSATFTVKSDTHLTAVVPAGASSGIVTVTTPGGPLSTLVSFKVRP